MNKSITFHILLLVTPVILHTMEEKQLEKQLTERELSPSPRQRSESIDIPKRTHTIVTRKERKKKTSGEDVTSNETNRNSRDYAQKRVASATTALIKLREMYDDIGLLEQKTIHLRELFFSKSDEAEAKIKEYTEFKKTNKGELHQVDAQILVLHKRLKELSVEVTKLEKDLPKL